MSVQGMIRAAAVADPVMLEQDIGPAGVQANFHRSFWFMRNKLIFEVPPPPGTTVSSQVAPPCNLPLHHALGERSRGRVTSPYYIPVCVREEGPSLLIVRSSK